MTEHTGTDPQEVLSVERLGVRLGGRDVLSDVSFGIGAAEFTGLIGSNGAGKTTLLKAILGLHPLSSGNIQVAGRPRSRRTPVIGYVPQRYLLDADMPLRARDVVGLGVDGHRLGLPGGRGSAPRGSTRCSPPLTHRASLTAASGNCPGASSNGC